MKYTAAPTSSFTYSLTFDALSEIVGVSLMSTGDDGVAFHGDEKRRFKINGNTISGQCRHNDAQTETITVTITAVGY